MFHQTANFSWQKHYIALNIKNNISTYVKYQGYFKPLYPAEFTIV